MHCFGFDVFYSDLMGGFTIFRHLRNFSGTIFHKLELYLISLHFADNLMLIEWVPIKFDLVHIDCIFGHSHYFDLKLTETQMPGYCPDFVLLVF